MSVIDDEFPRFNNDYFCNCDSIIEKKIIEKQHCDLTFD